jgi:hypothetical protein
MGLNGLLGFKGPTHLMPTQTHSFDTPKETEKKKNADLDSLISHV